MRSSPLLISEMLILLGLKPLQDTGLERDFFSPEKIPDKVDSHGITTSDDLESYLRSRSNTNPLRIGLRLKSYKTRAKPGHNQD